MKKLLFAVVVALISSTVWAQTGRVTKVRGGKAIVDFGSAKVSEGSTVSVGSGGGDLGLDSGSAMHSGRRLHGVSYRFLNSSTTTNPGSQQSKSTVLELEYTYNFGSYEIGGLFSTDNEESDGSSVGTTVFGPVGRYNFIENKPGRDFVPYVSGAFTILNGKTSILSFSGTQFYVGGGLNYFPFSQLFALDAGIRIVSGNWKVSSTTYASSGTQLYAGWKLYF